MPTPIETHILNIYNSPPPKGKKRWANIDIAEKLVADKIVDRMSRGKVRRILLKCLPNKNDINIGKWRIKLDERVKQEINEVLRSDKSALKIKNRVLELVILYICHSPPPKGKHRWSCSDIAKKLVRDNVADEISSTKINRILLDIMPDRVCSAEKEIENQILKIYRSTPPKGKNRWTYTEVAEKLVRDKAVQTISREKVRRILKRRLPGEISIYKWQVVLDEQAHCRIAEVLASRKTHLEVKMRARILLDLDCSGGRNPDTYVSIMEKRKTYQQIIVSLKKRFEQGGVELALFGDRRKYSITKRREPAVLQGDSRGNKSQRD